MRGALGEVQELDGSGGLPLILLALVLILRLDVRRTNDTIRDIFVALVIIVHLTVIIRPGTVVVVVRSGAMSGSVVSVAVGSPVISCIPLAVGSRASLDSSRCAQGSASVRLFGRGRSRGGSRPCLDRVIVLAEELWDSQHPPALCSCVVRGAYIHRFVVHAAAEKVAAQVLCYASAIWASRYPGPEPGSLHSGGCCEPVRMPRTVLPAGPLELVIFGLRNGHREDAVERLVILVQSQISKSWGVRSSNGIQTWPCVGSTQS